jgi:phosphate:Na+ symporter
MFYQVILILTGLFLFLFGMIKLSAGMHRIFNAKIREYIRQLVKSPIRGIALGVAATAIFQSSSATTVLVVGMVSAGLLSFFNSLGLILGSGIGTTITAQLVAFKFTAIAPIFIIIGVLVWIVAKDKLKLTGETIFYFGLLFFGLNLMGEYLTPLKNSPIFLNLIEGIETPLLAILIGFAFTAVVQSSSATTGILVILGQQGLIGIEVALPIILGANIGTTITAILASIGAGKNAKRTAFSHFLFKFLGVLIFLPFLSFFISFLGSSIDSVAQQVVMGHFIFSLLVVIIFFFLLKPFAFFVKKIIPGREKTLALWPEWLSDKYLFDVNVALEAVKKELRREIDLTKEEFIKATGTIFKFKKSVVRNISYIDLVVDNLQDEIMKYLDKISRLQPTRKGAERLLIYSSMVDDIERIGDHATNLARLAGHKRTSRAHFPQAARDEINDIKKLVIDNINDASSLISKKNKRKIQAIFKREEVVNSSVKQAKENHSIRFYKGDCLAMAGPIFNDMLVNFERISDHCVNIAEYIKQLD